MDKAPYFGSGDCRFESCHDQIFNGFFHYFLQALKEAMKVAIEYAETKLGAKMVQIGGTKAASNDTTDAGDFEVVDKPSGTLKDGPILHCRIGTPVANMIMVTASYAKFNVQQSQSGEFQSFTIFLFTNFASFFDLVDQKNPNFWRKKI